MTTTRSLPEVAVRYHRLGRIARRGWFLPILGTALAAVAALAAVTVPAAVVGVIGVRLGRPIGPDGVPSFGEEADLAVQTAGLALMIPIVMLVARLIQGRPAGTVSSVERGLRWGWLGRCLLLAIPAQILMVVISDMLLRRTDPSAEPIFGNPWVGPEQLAAGIAVVLLLVPLQAAGEEYMFRGWLLQAVGSFTRSPWPAIVLQAIPLALLHGLGTAWGMAHFIVVALITGWLSVRTGGLEAAIAWHAVNNMASIGLSVATGALADEQSAVGLSWQMAVVHMVVMSAYAMDIARRARRSGLRTTASVTRAR